jgi:hypothetical protein
MPRYLFDDEVDLAELEVGKNSTLRLTLVSHTSGTTAVGLRVWKDEGPGGYVGPTKQGLILPVETLEGVIVALNRAQATLLDRGAGA